MVRNLSRLVSGNLIRAFGCAVVLAFAGCDAPSTAQVPAAENERNAPEAQKAPAAANERIAPEARKVLDAWYAGLHSAKSLSFETKAAVVRAEGRRELEAERVAYRLEVRRPDKIAVRAVGSAGLTVVNDGKQLYQYDPRRRVYVLDKPLGSLTDLARSPLLSAVNLGLGMPLVGEAIAGAPLDKVVESYDEIEYRGVEEVAGAKRHHLRAAKDEIHFDLFFDDDARGALRRVEPSAADIVAKNGGAVPAGETWTMSIAFDNWTYDAPETAEMFAIAPPADASELEHLSDELAMTLIGKPAPSFEAELLDGGKFKLADQKGKIVVLDFWATWCPPCVEGLPQLAAMTDRFKADGVVFFPINLREEPDSIKEFLKEKGLKISVVLDPDAKAVELYKVEGVPQTVIIDREGVVRRVHVGIGELAEVPHQISELIEGKNVSARDAERK